MSFLTGTLAIMSQSLSMYCCDMWFYERKAPNWSRHSCLRRYMGKHSNTIECVWCISVPVDYRHPSKITWRFHKLNTLQTQISMILASAFDCVKKLPTHFMAHAAMMIEQFSIAHFTHIPNIKMKKKRNEVFNVRAFLLRIIAHPKFFMTHNYSNKTNNQKYTATWF